MKHSWVELIDGTTYVFGDPKRPQADAAAFEMPIEAVARQLSQINRFNGGTRWPYSVAQHSVFVSQLLDIDALWALYGLMHDAHEVVIGDIVRPVKWMMSGAGGATLDQHTLNADQRIFAAFGLDWPVPTKICDAVTHADNVALATERRDLMAGTDSWPALPAPHPRRMGRMSPTRAASAFIKRFNDLKGRLEPPATPAAQDGAIRTTKQCEQDLEAA